MFSVLISYVSLMLSVTQTCLLVAFEASAVNVYEDAVETGLKSVWRAFVID